MVPKLLTYARETSYEIFSPWSTAECSTVELPGIVCIITQIQQVGKLTWVHLTVSWVQLPFLFRRDSPLPGNGPTLYSRDLLLQTDPAVISGSPVFIAHAVLTLVHAPKGDSIVKFLT